MWQLMRRDWMLNHQLIVVVSLLLLIVHIFPLPKIPLITYFNFFIILCAYVFYFDRKNKVNRTIISLPLSKHIIVLARYVFLFLVFTLFFLYVWLLNQQLPGSIVLIIFTAICLAIAISLPIYYLVNSFLLAAIIQFLLLSASSLVFLFGATYELFDPIYLFFFGLIDIQPVATLLLLSFISLCISYVISCFIFAKKDIV